MPDATGYKTTGFMPEMRAWMRRENPPDALLAVVAEWEPALEADPVGDADDDGGMLFRVVPGTEHNGWVVTLSYAIEYGRKRIACASFACRQLPIGQDAPTWPPAAHH